MKKNYVVLVEGANIWMKSEKFERYGFFTTRFVRAANCTEAFEVSKKLIIKELEKHGLAVTSTGAEIEMRQLKVELIDWWQYLWHAPGKGFSFFLQ